MELAWRIELTVGCFGGKSLRWPTNIFLIGTKIQLKINSRKILCIDWNFVTEKILEMSKQVSHIYSCGKVVRFQMFLARASALSALDGSGSALLKVPGPGSNVPSFRQKLQSSRLKFHISNFKHSFEAAVQVEPNASRPGLILLISNNFQIICYASRYGICSALRITFHPGTLRPERS